MQKGDKVELVKIPPRLLNMRYLRLKAGGIGVVIATREGEDGQECLVKFVGKLFPISCKETEVISLIPC